MSRPELTPIDSGGKPAKPKPEESTWTYSPFLDFGNPPPPPPPPPGGNQPSQSSHNHGNRRGSQSSGQGSSEDSGKQDSANDSQGEDSTDANQSSGKQPNSVFVAGETGLSADLSLPDYVVPEENLRNISELSGSLRDPRNPIEMEAYLAARLNPLLHEVLIFVQNEGIPPALQGNVAGILELFEENGMDDADTREAERYLIYRMYGSSGHVHQVDPLDTAWAEAHDVFDPALGDKNNDKQEIVDYRALIETTYGVTLKRDSKANTWDLLRLRTIEVGLEMAAAAFGENMRGNGYFWDDATAFRRIIGDIDIHLSRDISEEGALAQVENRRIKIFWKKENNGEGRNYYLLPDVLLHELGHIFNANAGLGDKEGQGSINKTEGHPNTWEGMGSPYPATLVRENKPEGSVKFESWMEGIRPLHDILGLDRDDKLFRGVTLTEDQILLLRQSWATGDTNEITADATLNWIFHRITMQALGYTDDNEGKAWQKFMNDNMDVWTRNATVHNALQDEENIEFFSVRGMLPSIVGTGSISYVGGSNVRDTPSTTGKLVAALSVGEEVLIFGRTVVADDIHDWIAVLVKGDIRWIREDLIDLPEGVEVKDLQPLEADVGFEFDPDSPFEETTWFSQLVRHLS